MTIPREVGQLALDNLESLVAYIQGGEPDLVMQVPAIEALRAALAAKEPKETAYEIGQRFYRTGFGISDIWGAVSHDSQMDDAFRGYADAQMEKRGFGQEQAKEPEPVAWNIKHNRPPYDSDNPNEVVALRRREWQGLTDEEIEDACWTEVDQRLRSFARAIEAALRSKNT